MYTLTDIIHNDSAESTISEISFSPDGSIFAVSYRHNNEVRIFDTDTSRIIRKYSNPDAGFDGPHGVLLTDKYLIVSNKEGTKKPSRFCIFRLCSESTKPTQIYNTPFEHLREAHSLAIYTNLLVATYCESKSKTGTIVSYNYDNDSGEIISPIDLHDTWLKQFGDTKGISFDPSGERLFITFVSEAKSLYEMYTERAMMQIDRLCKLFSIPKQIPRIRHTTIKNGIAAYGIESNGRFTHKPLEYSVFEGFHRLENIHISQGMCAVSDPINSSVYLYRFNSSPCFNKPLQTIDDCLAFPHGVKISPDGKVLIIADGGLRIKKQSVCFSSFLSPRKDRVLIYKKSS